MEAKEIIRIIIDIMLPSYRGQQTEAFGYCGSSASLVSYLWVYVILKKENQILCVQNVLILKFFILIDI